MNISRLEWEAAPAYDGCVPGIYTPQSLRAAAVLLVRLMRRRNGGSWSLKSWDLQVTNHGARLRAHAADRDGRTQIFTELL